MLLWPSCHTRYLMQQVLIDQLGLSHCCWCSTSRVGNFRQKNYSAEDGIDHGTKLEANARNSVLNHSAEVIRFWTIPQKIKQLRIPFRGTKCKQTHGILFWTIPRKRQQLKEFCFEACLRRKHAVNSVCWSRIFFKLIFFMPFPPVPSFGIDSSVNLGMPRNEHFLPRNNGSCSESIPQKIFRKKFCYQP